MQIKESRKERKGRTVHEIHYYTDFGREIAVYLDDGKNGPYSKVVYFNASMMAVPCYDPRSGNMTFVQRAKPEYRADFQEVESRHPGVPQSEFDNV